MYGSFRTKTEANAWATSVEDAINKDEYLPSPEAKRRTVREMLERYRKTELPKKADQKNVSRYLDFWIDELGDRRLSTISRATIIEIRDNMAMEKSPATVNKYVAPIRHAYNRAVTDWEWTGKNPCTKLKLAEPRGRDRHLNDDELSALLNAVEISKHPHLHIIVKIAVSTGARRGEITSLRWREVDLATGRVVLIKTKNSERRSLAIIPSVVLAL
jgi:integrase